MQVRRRMNITLIVLTCLEVGTWTVAVRAHPPRKFIYGIWGNAYDSSMTTPPPGMAAFAPATDPQFSLSMSRLQDTLGLNMAFNEVWNHATAESLINRGFKVIEFDSIVQPGKPGDYAQDWYLVWQTDPSSIPPWYQGVWNGFQGHQMIDGSDTVWVIGNQPSDTRGWMCQTGGSHYKWKSNVDFTPTTRQSIYRIKANGVIPVDTVARICCVEYYFHEGGGQLIQDTVASRTILGAECTGAYQNFTISWPHQNPPAMSRTIWAKYLVYWFGKGTLYFDQVTSTDVSGNDLINGIYNPRIDAYTTKFTYGTDGSYILAWYLLDERTTPENAACWKHVSDRLRLGTGHKGGFQQFSYANDAWSASKMFSMDHFMCIDYLANGSHCNPDLTVDDSGAVSFSTDHPGGDSVSLQTAFDVTTARFRQYKGWADTSGSIFMPLIASVRYQGWCGNTCFERTRRASGFELRAHSGLALAYGTHALALWHWGGEYCYIDGIYPGSIGYSDVRDFVSPLIESLGDLFCDLKWVNAGKSEAVSTMTGSFISSVQSASFPVNPYVEVAFFKDTISNADYFMLVNRRCLSGESQALTVMLNRPAGMYYIVDQYSHDTTLVGSLQAGSFRFPTALAAGEWKLYKIIPLQWTSPDVNQMRTMLNLGPGTYRVKEILPNGSYGDSALTGRLPDGRVPFTSTYSQGQSKAFKILPGPDSVSGSSFPSSWQGSIKVYGNISIAAERTWTVFSPACISVNAGRGLEIDISGNLTTAGTGPDSVEFQSGAVGNKQPNDWYGIKILGAGNVSMEYTQVRHAYKGIWINNAQYTNSVFIFNCLFDQHAMAGLAIDANPASSITVQNSTFSNWGYYGLQVHKGKVDADRNTFQGDGLNGIRIDGAYQGVVTGGHLTNNTFRALTNPNAIGIYIYGVTDDGLALNDQLLSDNIMENNWTGADQVGIELVNCPHPLRFVRTSIHAITGKPGYGILNNSTNVQICGDIAAAESQSEIFGTLYGLYCWSGVVGDPDHAVVRQSSFYAYAPSAQNPGYGVWVSPFAQVDLGLLSDWGMNMFHGDCRNGVKTVVNTHTGDNYYIPANGNYWDSCKNECPVVLDDEGALDAQAPCGSLYVSWSSPRLSYYPFHGPGYAKPVVQQEVTRVPDSSEFGGLSNYPNPFNSSTVLSFSLSARGLTDVSIFNILGQRVRTVYQGEQEAGPHQVVWDGRDDRDRPVASGVYFYTVSEGGKRLSKSMIVLK